ncbi:MAG: Zn-dependent hydrolase [Planctomycetota bacterium]
MTDLLRVDGQRLWNAIMEVARVDATARGGCNRQALTDGDGVVRRLFRDWCEQAGLTVRVDEMGNMFARRRGVDSAAPPVIAGSHLDTQRTGGKFDGVYGVLAALEVIRTLNDADLQTDAPLEVVNWTNEEGARFSPAMIGSGVWSGQFDLEYGRSREDKEGVTIGQELTRLGFAGTTPCRPFPIRAAFELHIEQGPVLENEGAAVGVVTGVQGMRWYDVTLVGNPVHAGTTPMEVRRDPFMGLHRILARLYQLGADHSPAARVTFGDLIVSPGSRNTVPEELTLAIDLRHPDESELELMDERMRTLVEEEAGRCGLESRILDEWQSSAVEFDPDCVGAVRGAAEMLGYDYRDIVSGAGHDAVYVSQAAPTSMIFVPCAGGVSHNELEDASPADLEAGCNVLLHAMIQRASAV